MKTTHIETKLSPAPNVEGSMMSNLGMMDQEMLDVLVLMEEEVALVMSVPGRLLDPPGGGTATTTRQLLDMTRS